MKSLLKVFFFISIPFITYAQPPKGGILWLVGDSITNQSASIANWNDISGKSNGVTQKNVTSQPSLLPNILNGHSVVKFHGNGEYFSGPSIFPINNDYTIVVVIRIDDSSAINNIISGNAHALYFASNAYPRVVHADFLFQTISSIAVDSEFTILTVRYSNVNAQAKIYVDGQSGDSLYVKANSDSTLFIGAYQGSYTLNGAIAELALFDRQISEDERIQFESSLRTKYGLQLGNPVPKPDSTFTHLPADLQLYPRNKDDSAIVKIAGAIYLPGYDSIIVEASKNGLPYYREGSFLNYADNHTSFSFYPKIHAELSEWSFIIHLKNKEQDTVISERKNITCGDVYFIAGESNSTFGYYNVPYQNEYCRSFGFDHSYNIRDTSWSLSTATLWGDGPSVSGWGLMLQKHLVEDEHIPTCIIDGGMSGTILTYHLPDRINRLSLESIYGRLLYRAEKAHVRDAVKGIVWYHGELDNLDHYSENFKILYNNWKEDYPNIQKIYLIQLRPAFCVNLGDQPLRELFRTIQDSIPEVTSISSTMFPHQDGCHFHDDGFAGIADQLFPIIAKDFYSSTDTIEVSSPNITKAFYTTPQNTEVAMVFSPHNCGISATNDTVVGGISATIKDYFYPNDEVGKIESIRFSGDTVYLKLYSPSNAKFISHIPDRYYNGSDSVYYQGPWLKSSRGVGALIFWHFPIDNWKSGVDNIPNITEIVLEAIPNPAKNTSLIRFSTPIQEVVSLCVYDVLGRKVQTLIDSKLPAGNHEISFAANDFPAGEYLCRLQVGERTATKKIILTK